jgi:hypothetical protein
MSYLVLYGIFAVWVAFDSFSRKMAVQAVLWALGTLILGPIVLPIYLAKRPLKNGELREGGTGWNVLKNFAILWTLVMAVVFVTSLMAMGKLTSSLDSSAARAGAGIGMMLGMGFLAAMWFIPTAGAALLGFLLKKNSIVEKGPTGPLGGQTSQAGAVTGWGGLTGAAVVGLIVIGLMGHSSGKGPLKSEAASTPIISSVTGEVLTAKTPDQSSGDKWTESEKSNEMDNTKEVVLMLKAENEIEGYIGSITPSLVIRCMKNSTDAYVNVGTQVEVEYGTDYPKVRVKFDDGKPSGERWSKATSGDALFAPNAKVFAKKLAASQTFMFEFTPFQKSETMVKFDVGGLEAHLNKVSSACRWPQN